LAGFGPWLKKNRNSFGDEGDTQSFGLETKLIVRGKCSALKEPSEGPRKNALVPSMGIPVAHATAPKNRLRP
jgi:hypothetical protein